MKTLSFILAILIIPLTSHPELTKVDEEDPMRELLTQIKIRQCPEMIFNAKALIPGLYKRNEIDSIDLILNYVRDSCLDSEFDPLRILLEIKRNGLEDDWCDTLIINNLLNRYYYYRRDFRSSYPFIFGYEIRADNVQTKSFLYNSFIVKLAIELVDLTEQGTVSRLAALYYSDRVDDILIGLHDKEYDGTCFQSKYDQKIAELLKDYEKNSLHYNLTTGLWRPQGANQLLGNKFILGGQIGWRGKRIGWDITTQFRFLQSKNDYFVRHEGEIVTVKGFFSGLLGADFVLIPVRTKKFNLELIAGLGYDGVSTYKKYDEEVEGLNAFTYSVGFKPMFFLNKERSQYLGFLTRYNFVDYETHGGSDLSGNAISFELVLGWIKGKHLSELRRLRYFY